jgi:hypothetical protein
VNSCSFLVRKNLYDFLFEWQQRQDCVDQWLFVDQICINQDNNAERAHQVNQMASLYRSAAEVMIWLGSTTMVSYIAMTCLKAPEIFSADERDIVSGMIASHPYFDRLWIIQEILLAKSLSITWGDITTHWGQLASFLVVHKRREWSDVIPPVERIRRARETRYASGRYDFNWTMALKCAEGSKCYDKRDKVYGLLGLVDEERVICPDYTKSLEDIFMDMMLSEARNSRYTPYSYEEIGQEWLSELNLSMKPDYSSFPPKSSTPPPPAATIGMGRIQFKKAKTRLPPPIPSPPLSIGYKQFAMAIPSPPAATIRILDELLNKKMDDCI